MKCDIAVSAGTYRQAGQCYNQRAVRRIKIRDTIIRACLIHRKMIEGGRKLPVTR